MEKIQNKFKFKCPKHPSYNIELLQIDNFNANQKYQSLFYCTACSIQDSSFNNSNYELIKEIIQSGTDQILPKWPPLSDNQLIKQLISILKGEQDLKSIEDQILDYFTVLKKSIFKQIDNRQKEMMKLVSELPQNKAEILSKYQELSKINELRSILVDSSTDIHEKERQCKFLIEKTLSEKNSNTQQLNYLLNQQKDKQKCIFNQESTNQMKEDILNSISKINLFEYRNIPIQNNNQIPIQNNNPIPIQLDLQLQKTNFNDGQIYQEIIKNNNNFQQLTIKKQQSIFIHPGWYNTISNLILQNDIKYIFRIQIQIQKPKYCFIGLIQDSNINIQEGFKDKLSCKLKKNETQYISIVTNSQNSCIQKGVKGDVGQFVLCSENEIEMRVCLKDQILEILDYPHYHYKLALNDQFKPNLINYSNLRLYLGMGYQNNSMILKQALSVEKFE